MSFHKALMSRLQPVRPLLAVILLIAAQASGQLAAAPASALETTACQRLSASERLRWTVRTSIGPNSLLLGAVSAGHGTAENEPREYGGQWPGFGKRYGIHLAGVASAATAEAGLGAGWGEDPRYFRAAGRPFGQRVWNVVQMTLASRRSDGTMAPAYARLVAIPGTNFLSNSWRVDSEATVSRAVVRTLWGFLGRMGGNTFHEFAPDLKLRWGRPRP